MHTNPGTDVEFLRCNQCAIRHHAVCGALNQEELKSLNQISRQQKLKAGQVIISEEEDADFFANVVSGVVKLIKTLPDGRQQIVGLLFAPDFLGRAFGKQQAFYAEAATDVELCSFPHDQFERVLKTHPGLEHRLFEYTLNELDSAREWMLLLGRKTAEEKVASFLLMLAKRSALMGCNHQDPDVNLRFVLPLTRSDMADYLGLTIETVSRQITKLKARQIISLEDNRTFLVPDKLALEDVAGQ